MMRLRGLIAVLVPVALLGSGCSGGGGSISLEDWLAEVDQICRNADDAFDELIEEDFPTTPAASQDFFDQAAEIQRNVVEDIRDLDEPEGNAEEAEQALTAGDAAVQDFTEAAEDPDKASALFEEGAGENAQEFQDALVEMGAEECGDDEEGEDEGEGDDPEPPDPSTFSPEKAAFVEEADAVCRTANEVIDPAEEQYLEEFPPPLESWVAFLDVVAPAVEAELEQLRALTPPPGDEEQIDALFDRIQQLLDQLVVAREAAQAGDQEAFDEAFQPLVGGFDEVDAQARAYGFQVCGADE